jgi:CheY-like chemotaxis protein
VSNDMTRNGHLWIVEDSSPIRAVLLHLATDLAGHISLAASLAECEALLAAGAYPDAIVCDHELPDGTAVDVANLFAGGPPPRLIAITASAEDTDIVRRLRQAGFAHVLSKPVQSGELAAALALVVVVVAAQDAEIPDELRAHYERFVSDETRAIAMAYAGLSCAKLMHHLHKLAGTASVYGDKEVARAAAACEARLRLGEPLAALKQDLTMLFDSAGEPMRPAVHALSAAQL